MTVLCYGIMFFMNVMQILKTTHTKSLYDRCLQCIFYDKILVWTLPVCILRIFSSLHKIINGIWQLCYWKKKIYECDVTLQATYKKSWYGRKLCFYDKEKYPKTYTKSLSSVCEPLTIALNSTPSSSNSSGWHHSTIFPSKLN